MRSGLSACLRREGDIRLTVIEKGVWGVSISLLISVCVVIENYRCVWGECLIADFCECQLLCPTSAMTVFMWGKKKLLVKFASVSLDRSGCLLKHTTLSQVCIMFSKAIFNYWWVGLGGGGGGGVGKG